MYLTEGAICLILLTEYLTRFLFILEKARCFETLRVSAQRQILQKIGEALRECKVLVALVGPNWLAQNADGTRRIDDEEDWVRTELHVGLAISVPIVPVVLNRSQMPKAEELPKPLRGLSRINALPLESGRTFKNDIDELIRIIGRYLSASNVVVPQQTWFSAIFVFGRYKIAFSIATACLMVAVATALWLPRSYQSSSDQSSSGQSSIALPPEFQQLLERPDLSWEDIVSIQRALCVPGSELGTAGPLTLYLAKIFKETDRSSPAQKLTQQDVAQLREAGACDTSKFLNYFERRAFPKTIADPELIGLLNRVAAGGTLPAGASDSAIRSKIREVRNVLELKLKPQPDPRLADQLTPDLIEQLSKLPSR